LVDEELGDTMSEEPVVIEPIIQKDVWDCGVCCLSMLLGVPYATVRAQIRYKEPVGMSLREIRRVARSLGYSLRLSRTVDHEDIGVLILERQRVEGVPKAGIEGHVVMYAKGTLYNPAQGDWWTDVDSYLKKSRYRVVGILKRKEA
jgi:hypothetical protein